MIQRRRRRAPISLLALVVAALNSNVQAQAWVRLEKSAQHMGTEFAITVYATESARAETAIEAAFRRIEALDESLSNYKPNSELNQFCRSSPHATWQPLHPDLATVLLASQAMSRRTDGAFDVTIGPLTRLWRRARRLGLQRYPIDPERLAKTRARTGYTKLQLMAAEEQQHGISPPSNSSSQANRSPQPIRVLGMLTVPQMKLDLGGIAKGYALDEALATLKSHGVACALINGGGDIVVGDAPPGREGWHVGLTTLGENVNQPQLFVSVANQAVATSGDLHQFIEIDGQRFSHLIDPRTGRPVPGRHIATVIARRAIDADAWASALLVLTPVDGMALVERQPEPLAAQLVTWTPEGIESRRTMKFPPTRPSNRDL